MIIHTNVNHNKKSMAKPQIEEKQIEKAIVNSSNTKKKNKKTIVAVEELILSDSTISEEDNSILNFETEIEVENEDD